MKVKITSLIILFISFLAFLFWQAFGSGTSRVFLPSELMAQTKDIPRVRVAGRVSSGEVDYQVEPNFRLEFSIYDPDTRDQDLLTVVYQGIKPDMFASGRDVIIDGQYTQGKVQAAQLLTQCPSKYEPPEPGSS